MRGGEPLSQQVLDIQRGREDLRNEHVDFQRIGVTPTFRNKTPSFPPTKGYPKDPHQSIGKVKKLWMDAANGAIFVFANGNMEEAPVIATLSTLVARQLPSRTISSAARWIAHIRIANHSCSKYAYRPMEAPQIKALAMKVMRI